MVHVQLFFTLFSPPKHSNSVCKSLSICINSTQGCSSPHKNISTKLAKFSACQHLKTKFAHRVVTRADKIRVESPTGQQIHMANTPHKVMSTYRVKSASMRLDPVQQHAIKWGRGLRWR